MVNTHQVASTLVEEPQILTVDHLVVGVLDPHLLATVVLQAPQLALNMDHHLSVILNQAMVEVGDHHQDPPHKMNMDHLLSVILNQAMVEVEDHHQDPHKMNMDPL